MSSFQGVARFATGARVLKNFAGGELMVISYVIVYWLLLSRNILCRFLESDNITSHLLHINSRKSNGSEKIIQFIPGITANSVQQKVQNPPLHPNPACCNKRTTFLIRWVF
jgi:hypothetical protein